MILISYVIQTLAALFASGAAALFVLSLQGGRIGFAVANAVLFFITLPRQGSGA